LKLQDFRVHSTTAQRAAVPQKKARHAPGCNFWPELERARQRLDAWLLILVSFHLM
jgi:hypothetical protein